MAFKRKTYSRLLDWKNSCQGKKALLVEGARRIGKSTIVEEFAKNEYESYILIDFNDVSDRVLKNFDENLSDLDTFFMLLSAEYGVTLKRRKSVIIFDEILRFPKARQSIKKLVKDGRYDSDTFFWLGDSMIANECFNCNDPSIALAMNENRPAVKCYMGDIGLLVSLAFDANVIADEMLYKQILNDKISLSEGMLYENIVAQMLACNGHKLFFYNRYNEEAHRNDIEVDFLLAKQGVSKYKLYPIEVKSTKRYTTKSLDAFMETFSKFVDVAYIVHPKNLEKKGRVLCILDYMAMCL